MNDNNKNAIIIILVIALIVVVAFSSVMTCMYYMETQQKEISNATTNNVSSINTSSPKNSDSNSSSSMSNKIVTVQEAVDKAIEYAKTHDLDSDEYIIYESTDFAAQNDDYYLISVCICWGESAADNFYTVNKQTGQVKLHYEGMMNDWWGFPEEFGDFLEWNSYSGEYEPRLH